MITVRPGCRRRILDLLVSSVFDGYFHDLWRRRAGIISCRRRLTCSSMAFERPALARGSSRLKSRRVLWDRFSRFARQRANRRERPRNQFSTNLLDAMRCAADIRAELNFHWPKHRARAQPLSWLRKDSRQEDGWQFGAKFGAARLTRGLPFAVACASDRRRCQNYIKIILLHCEPTGACQPASLPASSLSAESRLARRAAQVRRQEE